jgi:hypothetical protein
MQVRNRCNLSYPTRLVLLHYHQSLEAAKYGRKFRGTRNKKITGSAAAYQIYRPFLVSSGAHYQIFICYKIVYVFENAFSSCRNGPKPRGTVLARTSSNLQDVAIPRCSSRNYGRLRPVPLGTSDGGDHPRNTDSEVSCQFKCFLSS